MSLLRNLNNKFLYKFVNSHDTWHTFEKSFYRFCHANARLLASPAVALHDVLPHIKAEGLEPGAPVTLEAEMFDDRGKKLMSNAHYIVDNNGEVDVKFDPSVGGSYKGIFPTGLLSSLRIADGNFKYGRIVKKNIEVPLQLKISLYSGHEPLGNKGKILDHVTLERHFLAPGVRRIPVKTGRIRGSLFLPEGNGPHPAVIDMFGGAGALIETRAALNASRGFATLALAYFSYDDIPEAKIFDLDLDYFEEATEWLLCQPSVIPDRCGVIANCLGGFIAQYMGIYIDKVKAVFAINIPFTLNLKLKYRDQDLYAVKKMPLDQSFAANCKEGAQNVIFYPSEDMQNFMSNVDNSLVELVNRSKDTKFFYAMAEDDCYRFIRGARNLTNRLQEHKKKDVTLVSYPAAGHMTDAPYSMTIRTSYVKLWAEEYGSPPFIIHWGGEAFADVQMQEGVWKQSFQFLNQHVRDESPWYQQYLMNSFTARVEEYNESKVFD